MEVLGRDLAAAYPQCPAVLLVGCRYGGRRPDEVGVGHLDTDETPVLVMVEEQSEVPAGYAVVERAFAVSSATTVTTAS